MRICVRVDCVLIHSKHVRNNDSGSLRLIIWVRPKDSETSRPPAMQNRDVQSACKTTLCINSTMCKQNTDIIAE